MKMRHWLPFVCFCFISPRAFAQVHSELAMPPAGNNQRAEISQWIGLVKVTIDYHSPNVHGLAGTDRTGHIWGELVDYGFPDLGFGPSHAAPWRVGANESTTITVSHDVKIEGKELKAGTYALFLDVEKEGPWTWIFSKNAKGWGSYQYDPKADALRVSVAPREAPYTEFMTFGFDERRPSSTLAYLQWEKKRVSFKIEVPNITQLYVDQMREDLLDWPGFNYQNWQNAAQFCADNKINLDEALVWAEKAIHHPFRGATVGLENFSTLSTKAAVLTAMGRTTEADAVMDTAVTRSDTTMLNLFFYGVGLLRASRSDRALKIFQLDQQRYPDEKFWTYFGMAQAYTALNDKPHAINNWEIALAHLPENRRFMLPQYQAALKKLKEAN